MTNSNAPAAASFARLSEQDSAPLYEVVKRRVSEAILLGSGPVVR